MYGPTQNGDYYQLTSPVELPRASGFLWNETMMIQATCRGYATAQFMQPEPAKYSHSPNLEQKTFMQPEQPCYTHHPGRFVYVKDEENGSLFSAPYEPVRAGGKDFMFRVGKHDLLWRNSQGGLEAELQLSLPREEPVELWRIRVKNTSDSIRKVSVYPYFTVGYMSWMNQSGEYNAKLGGIVCSSVTPYQKYQDYDTIKTLKDKTYLLAEHPPVSWEVSQEAFEGEGGLHNPSGVQAEQLAGGDSRYELPCAALQYRLTLAPGEQKELRFLFGPARTEEEIATIRSRYLGGGFEAAIKDYAAYIARGEGCLRIETPDKGLDNYVNHWLPRQMYYHGITNRLTTDPQTRNYLQDGMGMSYVEPAIARQVFLTALSQQKASGAMPDGIILHPGAELKYINQVPHTDHCVWLPVCLETYLDETADYALLEEPVSYEDGTSATVAEHIDKAVEWLLNDRDSRGLNYINQGDWCDPMNMVGYKGKGVSGWLTMGTAYAAQVWAGICRAAGRLPQAERFAEEAQTLNGIINRRLWDGGWYARGITDDNVTFGTSADKEGRIFINPQSWSILCGAADSDKQRKLIAAVEEQMESPYGVEKLAPAFTAMREDVGRVTQKFPGTAENGAVYNHASAFWIFALYHGGQAESAFRVLRKMLPGDDAGDVKQRGQLPVYIPNYYRGAWRQIPRTAGRSSHLFNTGTISWFYRCVIDGLFGLRGTKEGLRIEPQLPAHWGSATVTRTFRGAVFHIAITRDAALSAARVIVNGQPVRQGLVTGIEAGAEYQVQVTLPRQ